MLLRCLDFETTGEEPDVSIVEVGWADLHRGNWTEDGGDNWHIFLPEAQFPISVGRSARPYECHLVNPGQPITPESSAIHHITGEDVIGAMTPPRALELALDCSPATTVLVAHHADSDKAALGGDRGYPWIDTWKIAVTLAPNAPGYGLQVLRYWLSLDLERVWSLPAHRAGPDAYVCAALLLRMLAKLSFEKMVEISAGPVLLPRFGFGKYFKQPIAEVPIDYLDWMLRQRNEETGEPAFDKNVIHTCMTEIEQRRKNWKGKL